jgi:thymidine phosphorylase
LAIVTGPAIGADDALRALQTSEQPETLVKRVDGLAIELQQPSGLRRRQIETKTLHSFSDPIVRQLAPLEHFE